MNADIRLSVGFWQHPKVFRLEKRLGLKGVRSLQILWCWCAQNRPDGDLADLDASEIEFVADWRGKKGAFIDACIGNWLDETEDGYRLHEWADYNPWQAKAGTREEARKEKARNAANARWGKDRQSNANACSGDANADAQNAPSICKDDAQAYANEYPSNAPSNAKKMPPLPIPLPEEIKESSLRSDSFCAEQSCDSSTLNETPGKIPPLICLPLNDGKLHAVMPEDTEHWQELYPAVDVHQELRNMLGWLEAHPKKRKTAAGIKAFITRWLASKQDRGGTPRASPYPGIGYAQPSAPTEFQKNMQERRLMASALLAKRQEKKQLEGDDAAIDTTAIGIAGRAGASCADLPDQPYAGRNSAAI